MLRTPVLSALCLALAIALLPSSALADDAPPKSDPPGRTKQVEKGDHAKTPMELLAEEVKRLNDMILQLRQKLAETNLVKEEAQRELEELRQFIADHHEYGDDFQQYQAVKQITDREVKWRIAEARRHQREQEKAERNMKREEARRAQEENNRLKERENRYTRAGFASLGLNVYAGRMGYFYNTKGDGETMQIEYDPLIGQYYRPGRPTTEIDYGAMTISGSILNASDEIRNIGVAITFFDQHSNQVGSEIIQINNARPDVPYPFTSTIDMALNRAFSSSSTYVLYADKVATPPPADDTTGGNSTGAGVGAGAAE